MYQFDGSSLNLLSTLDGPENGDLFGSALDMTADGNFLLVGAPGPIGSAAGAVYYYQWDGTEWSLILPVPGTNDIENLGTSVAILDGDTIAMGAPNVDGNRGAVRVYRRLAGSFWNPLGGDIMGEPGDFLGTTLSASSDNRLVAGTASGSFRVFEFDPQRNEWVRVGSDEPSLDANVASIASTSHGDVALGLDDGSVVVYGL